MRTLKYSCLIALLLFAPFLINATERGNNARWGHEKIHSWGRGSVKIFSPSNIAWSHYFSADYGVEADSNGTPAGDGDVVFFWLDQSGNNNTAYQGINANRPIFQIGVNGSNNGLLFDSIDDFLSVSGNKNEGEFTYYAVFSTTENGSTARTNLFGHSTSSYYVGAFTFNVNLSESWLSMRAAAGENRSLFGPFGQGDGNIHVIGIYVAGVDGPTRVNDRVYLDGVTWFRNSGDIISAGTAWGDLLICRTYLWYGGMALSEFGIYEGKMPEADRINLQNYWIKKYGIE